MSELYQTTHETNSLTWATGTEVKVRVERLLRRGLRSGRHEALRHKVVLAVFRILRTELNAS